MAGTRWSGAAVAGAILLAGCVQIIDGDKEYHLRGSGGSGAEASSASSGGATGSAGGGSGGSVPCSSTKWNSAFDVGIVAADSALNFAPGQSFSVGFWALMSSKTFQHLVVKGDNGTNEWSITYVVGSHELCLNKQGMAVIGCGPVAADEWHHYVVAYEAGKTVVFMDGAEVGTGVGNIGGPHSTPLKIGNFEAGLNGLKGLLDELAIWEHALSAAEAASLHDRTKRPADLAGLVAEWAFDEGSGSTVADGSGHGHILLLSNVGWEAECAP